jgi:asparagine synthase (glutamine-hydrolysing)
MCGIALSTGPEADPHLSPDARRPRPARRDHNARHLVGAAKWNAAPVVRRLVGPRRTSGGDEAALPG